MLCVRLTSKKSAHALPSSEQFQASEFDRSIILYIRYAYVSRYLTELAELTNP